MNSKPANRWEFVTPGPSVPTVVHCIVEIPRGRRSKFEIDKETGLIRLDRYLYSSLHYPGDYGFIPQTLAEDGDAMDILVMVNEPTFSGCLIEARPIGLFKMTDRGANDYKILAVPASDPTFAEFHDLWRVPAHFLREVEHFFATYKQLEEATVQTLGWEGAEAARREVLDSVARFQESERKFGRRAGDTPTVATSKPKPARKAAGAMKKKATTKKPVRNKREKA
jgi:inorganic pyrophosphatase